VINLLLNACQASPPGGRVAVGVTRETHGTRDYAVVRVVDEGPGVAPEARARIFTPFFTTRPDGHGLGLAVSQNIVLEHGGRLVLDEAAGPGASFSLWIPLVR
jgi:signal transduction histidine kinase